MKKQDLLNDLKSKFSSIVDIGITEEVKDQEGKNIAWYTVNVLEKNTEGTAGVKRNLSFYVINEGKTDEEAFYQKGEAEVQTRSNDIREKLKTFLNSQVSKGMLIKYTLDNVNEENKFAIITGYVLAGEDINENKYLVYQDDGGQLRKIV